MYGSNHVYFTQTIELANEYVQKAVKEPELIRAIRQHFLDTKRPELTTKVPYKVEETSALYFIGLKKCNKYDKGYFARLCRILVYTHFYESLVAGKLTDEPVHKFAPEILLSEFSLSSNSEDDLLGLPSLTDFKDNTHPNRGNPEKMNTLARFKDVPFTTVDLIHGKPIEDYTESELLDRIRYTRSKQEEIADMVNISKRMKQKHEDLSKAIEVYVKALDSLK